MLLQHGQRLDSSTLRTFLYEVMAVMNSRPLSPQNLSDPLGQEPLTPNHLIMMKPQGGCILPPPGEFQKEDLYARNRWRKVQHLVDVFWTRWQKEYILLLQSRHKWRKKRRNVTVGDIVIIRDEDLVRGIWTMGKIVDVIADSDGLVRRAKILVGDSKLSVKGKRMNSSSILERPVHKLVLLLENEPV